MRLALWDATMMQWDAYRRPHRVVDRRRTVTTVQSDTGEAWLVIDDRATPHDRRQTYFGGSVRVVGTRDANGPVLTLPDGTPCPRAWLGRTQRCLVIDEDTGHVVMPRVLPLRTATRERHAACGIPLGLFPHTGGRAAPAWAGEGMPPCTLHAVRLTRPVPETPATRDIPFADLTLDERWQIITHGIRRARVGETVPFLRLARP